MLFVLPSNFVQHNRGLRICYTCVLDILEIFYFEKLIKMYMKVTRICLIYIQEILANDFS